MWNRSISAAIIDCITVCALIVAACGLFKFGYEYANLRNERNQLIEVVEEVSAEKAMLEGLIDHNPLIRPNGPNQGWIPPTALED